MCLKSKLLLGIDYVIGAIQQILVPSNANKVLCLFEVHLITRITRGTASGLEGQTYGKQLNLASKVKKSKNVVNKT